MPRRVHVAFLAAGVLLALAHPSPRANAADTPGFLVLAPDRGSWGNEEIHEIFAAYRPRVPIAELAFVTHRSAARRIREGLERLRQQGVTRAVAIPLFFSAAEERHRRARVLLGVEPPAAGDDRPLTPFLPVTLAPPFAESFLATEVLRDRLTALGGSADRLILLGYGAASADQAARIEEDLRRVQRPLHKDFPFREVQTAVLFDHQTAPEAKSLWRHRAVALLKDAARSAGRTMVVPLFLGWKADPMMSAWRQVQREVDGQGLVFDGQDLSHREVLVTWLLNASNRHLPVRRDEVGVVILSHGADLDWNDEIRSTFRGLDSRYLIEYDFSMAHPQTLSSAIGRLERRGARFIVVLLAFALEQTFRGQVAQVLGLTGPEGQAGHASHSGSGEPTHGGSARPLRSGARFAIAGGVEDSPLFARVLLDRARESSRDPGRETVILVGHGAGDDGLDRHWHHVLASLASQMRQMGGAEFREIRWGTWREDWPEKRGQAVQRIREMVQEAGRDGGRALIVDARVNGPGPGDRFLAGLDYANNSRGFAPHPTLKRWAEEKIEGALRAR